MRILVALNSALILLCVTAVHAQRPVTPFEERKVRALLRTELACLGCHALEGSGGRTAVTLDSIGVRRSEAWIRGMIEDPQRTMPGAAMPRARMPEATRELLVRFLLRQGARAAATPASAPAPSTARTDPPPVAVDGATLYGRWCASCHGAAGRGDGPNAAYLPVRPVAHTDATLMGRRSNDALFDAIAGGGVVMGRSARMPAFGATLSPVEIRALVAQVRAFCRCDGPAWSHDPVPR